MKRLLTIASASILLIISCKKDSKKDNPVHTSVPFLTAKLWRLDTITIDPPANYNQLTPDDQNIYNHALAWTKKAELTFNEDGSVTCGGNWDFGYYKWRMVNNGADIEVQVSTGTKDTLFYWMVNNQQFTYQKALSQSFDCTIIYH